MRRSAPKLPIRRGMLIRPWPATTPRISSFLARPANNQPISVPKQLIGPSTIKRFNSSGQSERGSQANDGISVKTCTIAELYGEDGIDFVRWLQRGYGFIVYRTMYGSDEQWELCKESLSRHARREWGFRVLFVEDEAVLKDLFRGQVRNIHNDWVSSVISLDPSDVPGRIGRIWYGEPGLDYFGLADEEIFSKMESDGEFQTQRFTLVSALWKHWNELPPQQRNIPRYLAPRNDREETRGYAYFGSCDLSPSLYRNLVGKCPNEGLKFLWKYRNWSCK
ncbi:hypothetical protein CKAH01_09379 [Colletotrichum kahawae]|uniref:Uncharacterized protein n=1 Tax=Colletotrichum kahawae TaxID=34407 RepID=A0AAD9Y0D9_COLKA|nr:hypothetical protein CKAH01_09379 [Colletotrichum kahawae]